MRKIEQVSSQIAHQTPWMTVRSDEVRFPDGSLGTYSVLDKRDFALVIAESQEGYWLVEQFRYPIGRRVWEFPQGGWAAGKDGSKEELAASELEEETGIVAGSWSHLGHLYAAYGYSNQGFDIFHATNLTMGEPKREASEQDMVHGWFSDVEVRAMIARGEFVDSHSIAALALLDQEKQRQA
ncbi:NUDIX domain-containing protein [Frankineae bacterium MT45]|nr:NUDIX domain-containing protein [Frankineae bacterium MT45]